MGDKGDMETVLEIMDSDGSGEVSYEEFVRELHKIKTQESHTLLVLIRHQVNQVLKQSDDQMQFLRNELLRMSKQHDEKLQSMMNSLGLQQTKLLAPMAHEFALPKNSNQQHHHTLLVTPPANSTSSKKQLKSQQV